jgi:hypothetical protein
MTPAGAALDRPGVQPVACNSMPAAVCLRVGNGVVFKMFLSLSLSLSRERFAQRDRQVMLTSYPFVVAVSVTQLIKIPRTLVTSQFRARCLPLSYLKNMKSKIFKTIILPAILYRCETSSGQVGNMGGKRS